MDTIFLLFIVFLSFLFTNKKHTVVIPCVTVCKTGNPINLFTRITNYITFLKIKVIIKVCKVNVDEEPDLAEKFGVMSIPTFVAIKDGEVLGTSIGVQDEEEILKMFDK